MECSWRNRFKLPKRSVFNIVQMITKERVVKAIITSRLDYCTALLYGTSAVNIARLQRINNAASRLIVRSPRNNSVTSLLRNLNSTKCPLCAELISRTLYSLTKPYTTTRQCICVNSCARINRQEQCAKLETARSLSHLRPFRRIYQRSLRLVTISPASNVY